MDNLDQKFSASLNIIKKIPKTGPIDIGIIRKLKFYSLYKIATVGSNNTPKPPIFDFEGRLKWNAWNSMVDIDADTAKYMYVREFGECLVDTFLTVDNKDDMYLNEDLSFLEDISEEDINILMDEVKKDDTKPLELKVKMLNFFEKMLQKEGVKKEIPKI